MNRKRGLSMKSKMCNQNSVGVWRSNLLESPANGEPGSGSESVVLGQVDLAGTAVELHHLTQSYCSLRRETCRTCMYMLVAYLWRHR